MSDSAREAILGRIRQALKSPAPAPHWLESPIPTGPWFALPADEAELRTRFRTEFMAIQGEWLEAATLEEGRQVLTDWLYRQEITSALAPATPALEQLIGAKPLVRWVAPANPDRHGWDTIDLGITPAESLVAESGTIVVSAAFSRALSVLPPIHLVVATADQLVPDLETSIARLRARHGAALPSTFSWISGPSRTADIEKILVLGAHGPRRLVILLLPAGVFDG